MFLPARIGVLALFVAALSACNHAARYSGDGHLVDNGVMSYARRFVVDLGPLDLSTPGTRSFKLAGLPRAEFVVGIDVVETAEVSVSGPEPTNDVVVRLELRTADGHDVIVEQAALRDWTRSYAAIAPLEARLYLRGESIDVELAGGGTSSKNLRVKHSGGWGSYFHSERRAAYVLTVTVLESDLPTPLPARVVLVGWGR